MTEEHGRPWQGAADVNVAADSMNVPRGADNESQVAPDPGVLLAHHQHLLELSGIPLPFAAALGVRSVSSVEDLPDDVLWTAANGGLPGLLFPWTSPDGSRHWQLRPDKAIAVESDDRPHKYVQGAGVHLLNVLGNPDQASSVWIVEGTKQHLAAAAYAPPGVCVVGIPGCWNAMKDGVLLPGLADLVEDRDVVLVFDADLATNLVVWQAADGLRQVLELEGARVCVARLPGGGKSGIDDLLGGRESGRRARFLERLVDRATSRLPARPRADAHRAHFQSERPPMDVSADRLLVANEITEILLERWGGWRLYDHGDVISELVGSRMRALNRGHFRNVLLESARFYRPTPYGPMPCWPDGGVIETVAARYDRFPSLDRVTAAPFLRPDGSVCQSPGYDEETRTFLVADELLGPVGVPDSPTQEQLRDAVDLLLDDWLGDLPLATQADRANLLALVLTPFTRGLVPLDEAFSIAWTCDTGHTT